MGLTKDDKGNFHAGDRFQVPVYGLEDLKVPDSTEFVIQALNKTGKPTVELILENELFPPPAALPAVTGTITDKTTAGQQMSSYLTRADTRYTMENGMRTVYIEEVIITAKAPPKKDYSFSYYMPRISQPITP